jgi:hypothetical protein
VLSELSRLPRVQKTHQSALQVQQKAEAMLQANHYDMDMIRDCAEKVASHWQQLMLKMEDRLKLVNASVAFYKTSEQVGRGPVPRLLVTALGLL